LTELIRFHEKVRKHFLLQNLAKYQKKKASLSHLFFEKNLEKNILTPNYKLFPQKYKKQKKQKKQTTTAKLYSLSSQPVRKKRINLDITSVFYDHSV